MLHAGHLGQRICHFFSEALLRCDPVAMSMLLKGHVPLKSARCASYIYIHISFLDLFLVDDQPKKLMTHDT